MLLEIDRAEALIPNSSLLSDSGFDNQAACGERRF
jgi:hypothetical protein